MKKNIQNQKLLYNHVYPVWLPISNTEEHRPLLMGWCAHQVRVDVVIAEGFSLDWDRDLMEHMGD